MRVPRVASVIPLVFLCLALLVMAAPPARAQCTDRDGDGYGRPGDPSCPAGEATDCNDADPDIHPGAPEARNGYDDDCDGVMDNDYDRTCDGLNASDPAHDVEPNPSTVRDPAIVWNGHEYGVVWSDDRWGNYELVFARLSAAGERLGNVKRVTNGFDSSLEATLVWSGDGYGVAWTDKRNTNEEIYFARLTPEGDRIGTEVRVTRTQGDSRNPDLEWSGQEYGLAWSEENSEGGSEIRFQRINRDGELVGESVRVDDVPPREGAQDPDIEWNGGGYGVIWEKLTSGGVSAGLAFRRISEEGEPLGEVVDTIEGNWERRPSLAWNGSRYGLGWNYTYTDDFHFCLLDEEGRPVTDTLSGGMNGSLNPYVVWTGEEFLVGLSRNDDLYAERIDADGTEVLESIWVESDVGADAYCHPLAWNGYEARMVFVGAPSGDRDILTDRLRCCADDRDEDDFGDCAECAPLDPDTYPGAPQICDGVNNDCDDPAWPEPPEDEQDLDEDGFMECMGDCDDGEESVYPGAPQECDGKNNDCNDEEWPEVPPDEADADGDSYMVCSGDCDDSNGAVYPGAEQVCDGVNNDCDDPAWPALPPDETDDDGDGYSECAGDCDDTNESLGPGVPEVCNGIDDDCDGMIDDDELGEDIDGDGVHNACDNCRDVYNADQVDADVDGVGNACDNCMRVPNPGQENTDGDSRGDACDNCPETASENFDDSDGDGLGDVCDNCIDRRNESQHDLDDDGEGDECDLDDGGRFFEKVKKVRIRWQEDPAYGWYNLYRGSVAELLAGGPWTQEPGSNPYAAHFCDLGETSFDDDLVPATGEAYYWLVTGESAVGEEPLGDGAGVERTNDHPCP